MNYIIHRGGDHRWVLQNSETGGFVGLVLLPFPGETPQVFAYDFGSTYSTNTVLNWQEFPELAAINFFAIEYPSFHDFDRYFHNREWQLLENFLRAEAKIVAYNVNREKKATNPLPILWQYTPANPAGFWKIPAWGLWVNQDSCWLGNRDGWVIALSHQGAFLNQYKLPKMVRCLVGNQNRLLAACDDGYIYSLGGGQTPQLVYNARSSNRHYDYEFHILALNYHHPYLLLADVYGQVTLLNSELQVVWVQKSALWRIWFLEVDERFIYLGHSRGVNCYYLETGKLIWKKSTTSPVLTGTIGEKFLIVGCSDGSIYRLDFITQEITLFGNCEGSVYACTISEDAQYLFAGDYQGYFYCLTITGNPVFIKDLGIGALLALKSWQTQLYGVTTNGTLVVVDISRKAIADYESLPTISIISTPKITEFPNNSLSENISSQGVLVECFKQGKKLKVRVLSPGYNPEFSVHFPSKLRQEGMRYWVAEIREATQGGFYRVYGKIQPLSEDI